jgi:hypothetical protein
MAKIDNATVNILCLKHGSKYSSKYVNTLYSMVDRHLDLPYKFYCLTENPKGLDPKINVLMLPGGLHGWWYKPYIFSDTLPIEGTILYIDLDVVISSNLNKLFTYCPGEWCVIRDFTRSTRPDWQKYNSSVIRFEKGQLGHVWKTFSEDPNKHIKRFFGDQDFLYEVTKDTAKLWPDEWIQSWKWEVRASKELNPGPRGSRTLKTIENVSPSIETCICVFHGDPNPEHCLDPWVVDNWK